LVEQLEAIIQTSLTVMRERDDDGWTLIHFAAQYRSVDFIKVLVESDRGRECVGTMTIAPRGRLPIHIACIYCNFEVAKYLLSLYPESINIPDDDGYSLLHIVVQARHCTEEDREELTIFLIQQNESALTLPDHYFGDLPLHAACSIGHENLSVVKLLYDAHPQAMEIRNNRGDTPLDAARLWTRGVRLAAFLQSQLELQHQARDIVQPDANGQLPIHRVLRSFEPSLGTIKLMVPANPDSLTTADNQGFIPLHVACKFGHLDIVTYLIEAYEDSLQATTVRGYLPLHIACLSGKCNVVNYILERSGFGISSPIHGKLPIDLLLSDLANCDRNSLEYVEAVGRLLRANPWMTLEKWVYVAQEERSPIFCAG
jgi:ankyrin repeat protein